MAINSSQLSSSSVFNTYDVTIDMLATRPVPGETLAQQVTPNVLVGYYDAFGDYVELYLADNTGFRYLRVA